MNTISLKRFGITFGTVAVAALLLVACSKQSEQTAADAKSAKPAAEAKAATSGARCAAHGAPKELCFICDAGLREKGRLWCKEHNRYEDRCWECHPEAQDKNRLYCKEHSLYEDECFLCHPELLKKGTAPTEGKSGASTGGESMPAAAALFCKEHGVPENECGICHPELLSQKQPGQGLKVRLPNQISRAIAKPT